jgi:lipoic acid synthetase
MNLKKPQWLRKKISFKDKRDTDRLLKDIGISTVCQEAKCPNISECFREKQATFLILGSICSRACTFCNISKGKPSGIDTEEINKILKAIKKMNLRSIVITSVTRDDLSDGGAKQFSNCVKAIKKYDNSIDIELLIPDMNENKDAINSVANCGANIVGHNIETIKRRYDIRGGSDYHRSIRVLEIIKELNPNIRTKSALMLGLGERENEVIEVFKDLLQAGCDFLSIGQYLRPSKKHVPVLEFVKPEIFDRYRQIAIDLGFKFVYSSPYARSSYKAYEYLKR